MLWQSPNLHPNHLSKFHKKFFVVCLNKQIPCSLGAYRHFDRGAFFDKAQKNCPSDDNLANVPNMQEIEQKPQKIYDATAETQQLRLRAHEN